MKDMGVSLLGLRDRIFSWKPVVYEKIYFKEVGMRRKVQAPQGT